MSAADLIDGMELQTLSKAQRILEDLGARIVSGALPVDSVMSTEDICAVYHVSRSVLREVLARLRDKGLVSIKPNTGVTVAPHAKWNLLDPDVGRWAPDGSWLARDLGEYRDCVRELAAARPHNAVMAYAAPRSADA